MPYFSHRERARRRKESPTECPAGDILLIEQDKQNCQNDSFESPCDAIARHVAAEDKGVTEMVTPGGKQKMTIINESGLYSLILSSKLPKAREFKRWVTGI